MGFCMSYVAENIDIFLPKYLSESTVNSLIDSIKQFPTNIDDRIYGSYHTLDNSKLFQGDGIKNHRFAHIISKKFYSAPCVLVSNTCDMDLDNPRHTPLEIC